MKKEFSSNERNESKKFSFEKVTKGFEWFSYKIGQQRHLAALKDSLMFIMPLIIVGALGVLIVTIVFGGWSSEKTSLLGLIWMAAHGSTDVVFTGSWKEISDFGTNVFAAIKSAGIGAMSLFVAFFIGYFIAKSRNNEKTLYAALVSLSSFLIMINFDWTFLDAKGMFPAIIVALIASEVFCYLSKAEKLKIKLPASVPPMVSQSFSVLLPFLIILSGFGLIQGITILGSHLSHFNITSVKSTLVDATSIQTFNTANPSSQLVQGTQISAAQTVELFKHMNVSVDAQFTSSMSAEWTGPIIKLNNTAVAVSGESMSFAALVYHFFTLPITSFAGGNGGLGLGILHQFLCAFFFFFGIHGSNLTSGIFDPIWLQTHAENIAVLEAGGTPPHIFTQAFFWIFANIGGTGSTLSLIIIVLLFSKNKGYVEVSKFAVAPGVFQVNEPVTFGFPIVANPILAIPFILNPIITIIVAWLFIGPLGIVNKPTVLMPWTMPNIIGAPLVTRDWKAIFITLIQIGLTLLTYFPAVLIDNKVNGSKEEIIGLTKFKNYAKNGFKKTKQS